MLAVHQVVHRVAWIFKTESVIMPAFLDAVAGDGALRGLLRGFLPVINRFGHSVPPLLYAERLRRMPRKKVSLVITSALMAVPFLALSAMWLATEKKTQFWMPFVFLALYAVFFMVTGLNQLGYGTLQGKLIRPHRRGRLLGWSGIAGSVCAIACAWFLLARWLAIPDNEPGRIGGFGHIFAFVGMGFLLASVISFFIREPADAPAPSTGRPHAYLGSAWTLLREDAAFRRLVIVAMLFLTMQQLFPHFAALGRQPLEERTGAIARQLMLWVVVQNAGTGLFAFLLGPFADRYGYRLTLRIVVFIAAIIPVLALLLARGPNGGTAGRYWIPFFLLGLVPITMRSLANYTLELSPPDRHPHYLSTLTLCMGLPFVLSPLIGLLIDVVGFGPVFVGASALVTLAGLLTFGLKEPREDLR
ncbi:MAG: MFS transporter [Planctomycetaceae bacterium]